MSALIAFLKREAVLCVTALCAAATMLWVPPSAAYGGYLNLRVLALLFCLMAVVAGLQECGLFTRMAHKLLAGQRPLRLLLGVNLGGLGTPVASLASLISLKLYSQAPGARPGRYLALFLGLNLLFLAVLYGAALLFTGLR